MLKIWCVEVLTTDQQEILLSFPFSEVLYLTQQLSMCERERVI